LIYGAQIIGGNGVDKRIDVLSTLITYGGKITQLSNLEVAYAPPFNSAKDPLNQLGFMAENVLDRTVKNIVLSEKDMYNNYFIIDVRTTEEYQLGHIPTAINIPLHEISSRLTEIPRDHTKKILLYCVSGNRSYKASRILSINNIDSYNLNGGYIVYKIFQEKYNEFPQIIPKLDKTVNLNSEDTELVFDYRGFPCPGPIVKLHHDIQQIKPNTKGKILVSDSAFLIDLKNSKQILQVMDILEQYKNNDHFVITFCKKEITTTMQPTNNITNDKKTELDNCRMFLISTDNIQKVTTALMIAITAMSLGDKIKFFFIFSGINLLKKNRKELTPEQNHLQLFGTQLSLTDDRENNSTQSPTNAELKVPNISQFIQDLVAMEAEFFCCSMAMSEMGLTKEDLYDFVQPVGMMTYLNEADKCSYNVII
jgi:rhodanese-related sulfurtransferase/peroxiredoxin family protein/TusA-related sulfurtransferase